MNRILFYGDSNTYGYDPRSYLGGRYPASVRWTDRLMEYGKGHWEILPYGMNGRCIPQMDHDRKLLDLMLEEAGRIDLFACMLGTNDIFLTGHPDAMAAKKRMDAFAAYLKESSAIGKVLLIAPPAADPDQTADRMLKRYLTEARRLSGLYRRIADDLGIEFADAGAWNIPLEYDSVHFSMEGHSVFADEMKNVLKRIFPW